MHVRIAQFHVPRENWDQAVLEIKDHVVPTIRQVPGFVSGFFVGDRAREVSWGIVFWESEEAMESSEDEAARIRADASRSAGLEFTGVERFEVVAFATAPL